MIKLTICIPIVKRQYLKFDIVNQTRSYQYGGYKDCQKSNSESFLVVFFLLFCFF